MGAGQGKTIVILLIAAYIASETTNVKIVVLNEVLKEQMLDDINRVLQGNKWITVIDIQALTAI
jgi:superfamily II DNA or RNA helicase